MRVDIRDIPPEGLSISGEEPAEVLDLTRAGDPAPCRPVRYELRVQRVDRDLIVRGRLSAELFFVCSRCAEPFLRRVEDPDFVCVRELGSGAEPAEREGAPEERAAQTAEAESVDLTPEVREAILIAFPSHPVCKPECRGLCCRCGINLNRARCDCGPPADVRWDALDMLGLMKGTQDGRTKKKKVEE